MNSLLDLLYPLNEYYEQSGVPLPPVSQVEGSEVPEPYRSLLVHERDMTPTLEAAYRRNIHLRVLEYAVQGDVFSRQIVLALDGEETAVEFGAIKIYLAHFPPAARELVLERTLPLGTILRTQGIEHASRPVAYIQVQADAVIGSALRLTDGGGMLYGRRNVLRDRAQRILAQVVEILPATVPAREISRSGAPNSAS